METQDQSIVKKDIWDKQLEAIKQSFAPNLSDVEFNVFVQLGKSLNLSPFKREIWAVKYGNNPASIFVGRDGYRKTAQEQSDYNGHCVEAIYSKDTIKVVNGKLEHEFSFIDRGTLVGAYCEVYRRGIDWPFRVMVKFLEYTTNKSTWISKPETMIKKVSESQGLRMAYQGLFGGTYDESENWNSGDVEEKAKDDPKVVAFRALVNEIKALLDSQYLTPGEKSNVQDALDREKEGKLSIKKGSDFLATATATIEGRKKDESEIEEAEVVEETQEPDTTPSVVPPDGETEALRYQETMISGIMKKHTWERAKTRSYADEQAEKFYGKGSYRQLTSDECEDLLSKVVSEELLPF